MISGDKRPHAIWDVQLHNYNDWRLREQEYGPFFTHSMVLLRPCLQKLDTLAADSLFIMYQGEELDDTKGEHRLIISWSMATEVWESISNLFASTVHCSRRSFRFLF